MPEKYVDSKTTKRKLRKIQDLKEWIAEESPIKEETQREMTFAVLEFIASGSCFHPPTWAKLLLNAFDV